MEDRAERFCDYFYGTFSTVRERCRHSEVDYGFV
jgi:hypothetical protein